VQAATESGVGRVEGESTGSTDEDGPAPRGKVGSPPLAEFPQPLVGSLALVIGEIGEGAGGVARGRTSAKGGNAGVGAGWGRGAWSGEGIRRGSEFGLATGHTEMVEDWAGGVKTGDKEDEGGLGT
jgi:hypothetical protein